MPDLVRDGSVNGHPAGTRGQLDKLDFRLLALSGIPTVIERFSIAGFQASRSQA